MKVILDYDDVLNECNEEAIRKLNKEYGYSYCLEDITNWGILENELDKRIPYFVQPKFVRNIPIREGARKLVCELLKKHCEIFIATSVPSQCAGVRIADIIRNFPEIDPGNILIGSRKDILVADILLDDCYFNIEHSNVRYPVLFRKPWNAQYTGMPAVSDYKEFLKLVDMLLDSKNKLNRFQNPNIFILVGPSASGKSTVQEELLKTEKFIRTKSCTTRAPRKKDDDYYFLSMADFKKMEENEDFLETTFYKGNYYGTSYKEYKRCSETGKKIIFVMDINGALRIKKMFGKKACTIFLKRKPIYCIRSILDRLHTGELTKEDAANRLNFLSAEYENEKFCEISIENNAIEDVVKQIMDI